MPPSKPDDLRTKLRSVFSGAKVPTNPAIAAAILRLADDPSSTAEQFAEVIRTDVALSARLLKVANGAMFAQREPVTTIKRAVMILGLRRIRMLALGFQLVSHLDRLGGCSFDLNAFWQQSVLRGCLAREIAMQVAPGNAEEAFVIGLLQDCGILLLVQVLDERYADLYATASLSPTAFYERERSEFPFNHVETIAVLAEEWKLPDLIARPLARHHDPQHLAADADDADRLSAVAHFVGSLALEDADNLAAAEPRLVQFAAGELGMNAEAMSDSLRRAGEAYRQIAPLLPEHLPDTYDVAELLDRANRHLIRVASEAESRVEVVEAERDRFRREQRHLRTALGQYRERAAHDPLTRLLNRGALMDALLGTITECRGCDEPIAVYFLDLDDFKIINDEFGHHIGDEVLHYLAGVIGETIVNGGFAGRYGGEEFVIVIPSLDEAEAQARAQMIVDRVRRMRLDALGPMRTVTCSVGAVWGRIRAGTAPTDLFTAADTLMYQAKLAGKDHCRFMSLADPDDVKVLGHARESVPVPPPPVDRPIVSAAPDSVTSEHLHQMAMALNRSEPRRFATIRKRERHPLVAPARLHCFATGSDDLVDYPGYVRNISTGGVGVLTTRPLIRGEPVEVAIESSDATGQRLYVAGLVAHCRHVRAGIYEVGVQLVVQGRQPILTAKGDEHLDWVIEALQASQPDRPLRESA